jgi:AraC-like DNA-binding protein
LAASFHLQQQFLLPPAVLLPVISHFYRLWLGEEAAPVEQVLLPNFQVMLFINLGSPVSIWFGQPNQELTAVHRLEQMTVVGPLKRPLYYRMEKGGHVFTVHFTSGGFYRLFRVPVHTLDGLFTNPDHLIKQPCFYTLWQQLQQLSTVEEIVTRIASFTKPYMQRPEQAQEQLLQYIPLFTSDVSIQPVKWLAAETGMTERSVQLRFQKYLGFSAKELLRFMRFRKMMNGITASKTQSLKQNWFDVIEQYNYYDQAHLIHDFNYFIDSSPAKVTTSLLNNEALCFTRTIYA